MKVDCFKCQHFRVTWDQFNPRGCTAYGFKTKQLPSLVVKQSSGMDCLKFVPKNREGGQKR
ncbi:uracil-DNA glycosylase [Solibacillus sp. FSL W7-1436]|uniref:uracil-DNA glycosylase n=1 Tax=Solibacillus TaxID=648800 RepID=UPI0009A689D0|nr:uracil-DNA glycosylase [Solibacillus isronensis]